MIIGLLCRHCGFTEIGHLCGIPGACLMFEAVEWRENQEKEVES